MSRSFDETLVESIKVGEIIEVRLTWSGLGSYKFMGQVFNNGDIKRFKLKDAYYADVPEESIRSQAEIDCLRLLDEMIAEIPATYASTPTYPAYSGSVSANSPALLKAFDHVNPTFHMFLDGETSGSFVDMNGVTVTWARIEYSGIDFFDEVFV